MHSPLLAEISDVDLDHLAAHARHERFAAGEVMIAPGRDNSTLLTIWSGQARLEAVDDDGVGHEIADLGSGDVCGLVTAANDVPVRPRTVAVTDCEVVAIDLDASGSVISKNPGLSVALNQIEARHTRRIERLVAGMTAAEHGTNESPGDAETPDGTEEP